jgi:hypothetical protein
MKMNLYFYFYCRLYNFYKLLSFGTNDILEYSAMFALSILVFLNVVTLSGILELNGFLIILDSKKEFIGTGLLIFVVNYFIFIRKNKHQDIIREYSRRNRIKSLPLRFQWERENR